MVLNIDTNTSTNSQGAIIKMDTTNEKLSKDDKILKVTLNKEMSGEDPKTSQSVKISNINGLAIFQCRKESIPLNSQNKINLNINFQ